VKILNKLPFETENSTVNTSVGPIQVRPYQIIVWANLMTEEFLSRPFPAVLDTGANLNFIINESHLNNWLDLRAEQFVHRAMTLIDGEKIPVRVANVFLHRNVKGTRQIASGSYQLTTPQGIVVYPKTTAYPRLPLLGMRALGNSKLRVVIDGRRNYVSVDTGWFRSLFG
jgi:hypothetical protein